MQDKTIKKMVQDELEWEPSIDAADVGVTVENGVVRLTGHVANYLQKMSAEACVKRVKGVRGYVDDLQIRVFSDILSDEAIAGRVANLIDWHVSVPTGAVKVKVDKGFVTLTGAVDWQFQRSAAETGVRSIQGVRGLYNQIEVKPHLEASDIKRRIESALSRQANLDADTIRVTVDGGKVRLDGKVRAWFERDIAERAAWAAPGVSAVEDRVAIGV
ncbi:BON domain-containing protein [Caulobacter sp. 1776]|uniref:BON domain-containing protein n=1 Tax=Caulobacter sp. 1776 TaxID=3156420 RepID=UPI003390E6C5